jgi:hypothetical protein
MVAANKIIRVDLDHDEYFVALQAGAVRRFNNRRSGRKHLWAGDPRYSEQMDLMGTIAEACVAKFLNVFWLGGSKGERDVGGCEVRAKFESGHRLILHKEDPDDIPFVSVAVRDGVGLICGWVLSCDGKRPEYWQDPTGSRPAYFVPNDALEPIATLKDFLNQTIARQAEVG